MFCNTIKDRREKNASSVAVPRWIFSWEGKPSWPSMYEHVIILSRHRTASSFYQGTALHYHSIKALLLYILDTYTYYQGTTIYIVYIHIINTLLYMNKLFQFIHIMKFFRLFFQSRGRMTTVFVVFLLCCAGTSHFIRGWAVRILFGIFPRIAPFVKKFHSMRKFYKEGQGGPTPGPPCPSL